MNAPGNRRGHRTPAQNRYCFPRACRRRRSKGNSFTLFVQARMPVTGRNLFHVLDAALLDDVSRQEVGNLAHAVCIAAGAKKGVAETKVRDRMTKTKAELGVRGLILG